MSHDSRRPPNLYAWKILYDACLDPERYLRDGRKEIPLTGISVQEFNEIKNHLPMPVMPLAADSSRTTSDMYGDSSGFKFRYRKKIYSIVSREDNVILSEITEESQQ